MPRQPFFPDRQTAGRALAAVLRETYSSGDAIALAIPRGGVPVAFEVAQALEIPLDVIVPRKIPIPWEPEAGFGATTADGTLLLNDPLVAQLGLREAQIQQLATRVQEEVRRRIRVYRGNRPSPSLKGKTAFIIDDGLASGFTMLTAVRSVRKERPGQIVVAVPVSPRRSVNLVEPEVDELVCLIMQESPPFAVASFYGAFPDLSDEQVIAYLQASNS
ncbi:MAG: phosphoribosyltransferase [Chloroflexi bacterium B3_Chlor]|nr:MAG: phosphoribosyltransferase [Chloroflexi bacterium B3_Chlor]